MRLGGALYDAQYLLSKAQAQAQAQAAQARLQALGQAQAAQLPAHMQQAMARFNSFMTATKTPVGIRPAIPGTSAFRLTNLTPVAPTVNPNSAVPIPAISTAVVASGTSAAPQPAPAAQESVHRCNAFGCVHMLILRSSQGGGEGAEGGSPTFGRNQA